jgi:hypothetical protein
MIASLSFLSSVAFLDHQTGDSSEQSSRWLGDTSHQVIALQGRTCLGGDLVAAKEHECICLYEPPQQV